MGKKKDTKGFMIRTSDEIHKAVKIIAAKEGSTIQDYIINLIKEDIQKRGE